MQCVGRIIIHSTQKRQVCGSGWTAFDVGRYFELDAMRV
jgi:hypothetical protein